MGTGFMASVHHHVNLLWFFSSGFDYSFCYIKFESLFRTINFVQDHGFWAWKIWDVN